MKKVLTFFLCLSSLVAVAQAYPAYDNAHEIKLNVGLFLATGTVEGSYEYFFAEDISIGGTIYADNKPTDFNGNFSLEVAEDATSLTISYTGYTDQEISISGGISNISIFNVPLGRR